MSQKIDFVSLVGESVSRETLKKLVFSRPTSSEISKVSARLCAHRGNRILALEYSLPGNTVSQKNVKENMIYDELIKLLGEYKQANLITALGDAEWKISKSGKEILLGGDSLKRKLNGAPQSFESAIEELDKKKNYILSGDEDFLIALGISDKNGRVHDKRQAKFRQINRFLEHIEDVYNELPKNEKIVIYDLCCGKSYLSFAVYYYLTKLKNRPETELLGIDLKRDVIDWCDSLAKKLSYCGMHFICDDVTNTPNECSPDMVISLHACDVATDIVLNRAIELKAKVILSTPCCHKYLNDKINNDSLAFVTDYPQLKNKMCEAMTDAIRLARIRAAGYRVSALELTDPENTPKNTLLKAVRENGIQPEELLIRKRKYDEILAFLLGDGANSYLKEIL
ncbi:MAG: SAM-dependent methyltransferase [Ruminococcaceae bacterium]|nr:SAM-dependent methyltransferase [Oscillospiraceae bacterium]